MIEICQNCKSDNVARLQWVNPNTNEVNNIMDPGVYTEWCLNCNNETKIIEKENSSLDDKLLILIEGIIDGNLTKLETINCIKKEINTYLINKAREKISSNDDHSNIIEFIKIKNFLEENLPQI